ncbi:autophagy-related protein 18h-like [Iris pallida]|uniref:Autophagy-related protein 18h-like n=1 Tax=Iris pallida TaxID=29817 RepID=A0AAX6EHQ8_IRIPA|nr:autophagy-related protein 18h-like [Iris pallida]
MRRGKGGSGRSGLLPNSLRIISSCLRTVSSNAGSVASTVRSAGASVAASIAPVEDEKDQVLWVGFDKLELGPASFKTVLLLGYANGFQVLDVEDASNVCEMVSKRDGPVTYLQMQPTPSKLEGREGYIASHPLLLVVAGDETNGSGMVQGGRLSALIRENANEPQHGNCIITPTVVRFYSLKSHSYVHVLRFRSAVYMVRCSPRIVAVALAAQIYCFDAVTLENKFSVLTYPLQGAAGLNTGYGPMAVGPRWMAYASNNPLLSNTGRLSPQNLTPSPGVSPSTSPGNGSLVARYAMESSKQLAAGILNLGDMGYKTLSKYCHELIPDGSNSPLSNSGRRLGRLPSTTHPIEADNAGMVVVKDFISREIISQFRAHTSPISALCFDPSGTLLVTASVPGHNINVFRIMPTSVPNGSGSVRYDWTSAHVHLYKLYRGITTAVIQDICFSHYSQWISIVSSRGTCHIFVLSPFGGDASLQQNNFHNEGPTLVPNLTMPWWSTSSCMTDQQCITPPPPITLSVVSRIKNGNSGWLNTVTNVAASATGKIAIPSGALAAIFHNSSNHSTLPIHPNANSLEHLLVYSPSGHVIHHELLPSAGAEAFDSSSRTGSSPTLQFQDEDLHVNAEPVQWWDVCRRSNWPEREENITKIIFDSRHDLEAVMDTSDYEGNDSSVSSTNCVAGKEFGKAQGRPYWYLSNAEVQINTVRLPIWQKSKICFYMMIQSGAIDCAGGEIEIEKMPLHEVEFRRKDLLPVFEQVHPQSYWSDRGLAGGQYQTSSANVRDKFMKDTTTSKSASLESGSDIGSSTTTENLLDLDGVCMPGFCETVNLQSMKKPIHQDSAPCLTPFVHSEIEDRNINPMASLAPINASIRMPHKYFGEDCAPLHLTHSNCSSLVDDSAINDVSPSPTSYLGAGKQVATNSAHSLDSTMSSKVSNTSIPNIHTEQSETSDSHNSVEFAQYFHEGYCKVSELDDCRELTEAVTDGDSSSSHCEREKPEEDGDNDDMLGGVFAFSEEDLCGNG